MKRSIFIAVAVTLLVAACCPPPKAAAQYFGDTKELKRKYAGDHVDIFVNPKVDLASYQFIRAMPLTIEFSDDADLSKMDQGDVEKMQTYFRTKLVESLAPRLQAVEFPEEGVLEVRAVIRNFTPGKPVASLLSRDVLKYQLYLTDVRADIVFVDAASGQPVIAVFDRGLDEIMFQGKDYIAQVKDMTNGLDAWVHAASTGVSEILPERQPMPVSLPAAPDTTDMLQLPQQPVLQPTVWDQI